MGVWVEKLKFRIGNDGKDDVTEGDDDVEQMDGGRGICCARSVVVRKGGEGIAGYTVEGSDVGGVVVRDGKVG